LSVQHTSEHEPAAVSQLRDAHWVSVVQEAPKTKPVDAFSAYA
jgi:hypothetical protein